ncbi:hypothetical protein BV20DRAFT_82408 [Pilatotrama ljubarskyi]|nr:hypothetical protein BV20DRAFT_82408 [Pilatotrama ljubarskyi]
MFACLTGETVGENPEGTAAQGGAPRSHALGSERTMRTTAAGSPLAKPRKRRWLGSGGGRGRVRSERGSGLTLLSGRSPRDVSLLPRTRGSPSWRSARHAGLPYPFPLTVQGPRPTTPRSTESLGWAFGTGVVPWDWCWAIGARSRNSRRKRHSMMLIGGVESRSLRCVIA